MPAPVAPSRRSILASVSAVLGATALGAGCLGAGNDATPARREDDWRLYGRDPGRTRFVPDADLPRDGVSVAWERSVGASNWRPPVVASGTVYCQYSNGLFVVDRATGEGPRVRTSGGFGRGTGPMAFGSTRLYEDGVLVVPYGDSIGGYAADPDGWPTSVSGLGESRARWWLDGDGVGMSPPRLGRSPGGGWLASPLIVDGTVVSLHPTANVVAAGETDDGGSRWRFDLEEIAPDDHYVTPAGHVVDTASDTVVVKLFLRADGMVTSETVLVGIDLVEGTLAWTNDELSPIQQSRQSQDSLVASGGDGYTLDETDQYDELRLRELETEHGETNWERILERTDHVGLAADDTTVYHVGVQAVDDESDRFAIVAIDRDGGDLRWDVRIDDLPAPMAGPTTPPPTVAGDQVLVPGDDGLHALDRSTGDHLWTFTEMVSTSGGSEMERGGKTPAVVSGDRIVLGTTLVLYGLE
ncbi:hypothetical protein D8Y22_03470 [Salinadaptatus halalkaliphilus]|uniref:Pyrrolo-quinoline quinone repeat domain-containing protein n=1 Tax=Salinadaptatus halalkaliphilus TaxID=2419781 RepID=A0A4S3TPR7_9EURY|nr:PQQ-binding-like beta-propeller repeat protein [Salinadaptatus halalkaliphilus]THE66369.1 hypothetical protein D8Y22_03470 [Salinadaptatus halalkaliphilus]